MYSIALAAGIPVVLLVVIGIQIAVSNRKHKSVPATQKSNRV